MDIDNMTFEQQALMTMMRSLEQLMQRQQQQEDEIMHNVDQGNHRSILSALRPVKPDTFDGERNPRKVESWLYTVGKYCDLVQIHDGDQQVLFAVSLLRDGAVTWWRQLEGDINVATPCDWNQFCDAFRTEFKPENAEQLARQKLQELQQRSTVSSYVRVFRDTMLELPEMDVKDALFVFTNGLKYQVKLYVLVNKPDTLHKAYELAESYEAAQFVARGVHNPRPFGQFGFHNNHRNTHVSQGPTPMELDTVAPAPRDRSRVRCFRCGKMGHYRRECRQRIGHNNGQGQENWSLEDRGAVLDQGAKDLPVGLAGDTPTGEAKDKLEEAAEGSQHDDDAVHVALIEEKKLQQDRCHLEELNSYAGGSLPLYGGRMKNKKFLALIDTGASASYVSSRLCKDLVSMDVSTRDVETAGGHRLAISKKVVFPFVMAGCDMKTEAYILDTKFDVILGRNWLAGYTPDVDWKTDICTIVVDGKDHKLEPERYLGDSGVRYLLSHKQVGKAVRRRDVDVMCMLHLLESDIRSRNIPPFMEKLVDEYKDVFREDLPGLPPTREIEHVIDTGDAKPIARPPFKMSPLELDELKRQLDELLKLGLIKPSASPWGAPVLFVKKKDGSMRMCIDYRALNKVTIRNQHPLPRIDECLERLQGATYFTSLDLKSGYHQIRIKNEDVPKTAFNTRYGQYSFLVLPFGLCNAPPTFQGLMNRVLGDYVDRFALVYLDDILIFSKSLEEHVQHVRKVLDKLREAKLYANVSKCHFGQKEVEFLGFRVSGDGTRPAEGKLKAIQEWEPPTNVQEVRQFIGLAQHYRRFIPSFASIATPLTDLTKGTGPKRRAITWTAACQTSFDVIKDRLTSAPVLRAPDPNKSYRVECDASDVGVGAVLLQQDDRGTWHPLAFESHKLSSEERNYPAQERELLAILHALRTWRCFLEGRQYQVYTDHNSLKYLRSQVKPTPRLVRWMNELELFDPEILYKPGKDNSVPDALSRKAYDAEAGDNMLEPQFLYATMNTLPQEHRQDWPLYYVSRPKDLPKDVSDFMDQEKEHFVVHNGKVYRRIKTKRGDDTSIQEVRYLPFVYRADKVKTFHDGFGHAGGKTVFDLMRTRYWWASMKADIQDWLSRCQECQMNSRRDSAHHDPMHPLEVPEAFARWHLDFIGELPKTVHGNRWILVAVDYTTNYPIARAVHVASAKAVADFLYEEIVMRFGCPKEILTDRGSSFTSKVLAHYTKRVNINHKLTSAFHPRANGKCERLNGTLKTMLRKYVNGALHLWDDYLDAALFACRIRTHSTTGYSPFFMTYGRDPVLPGDALRPYISDDVLKDPRAMAELTAQELEKVNQVRAAATKRMQVIGQKDKERWDKALNIVDFDIGDYVKLTHEGRYGLEPRFKGPYVVMAKNNDFGTYKLETVHGQPLDSWIHADRLAKVNFDTEPSTPWFDPSKTRAEWRARMHLVPEDDDVDKLMDQATEPDDSLDFPGTNVQHDSSIARGRATSSEGGNVGASEAGKRANYRFKPKNPGRPPQVTSKFDSQSAASSSMAT